MVSRSGDAPGNRREATAYSGTEATFMVRTALLCLLLIPVVGCPTADDDDGHVCGDLTRAMTYTAGLEAQGADAALAMSLTVAVPAPPDVGDNVWTVQVLDASATPAAGCTATVTAFMPDHGHGAAAAPTWGEDAAVIGQYTVDGIDMFMPGYWELTFDLDCGGTTDSVVYGFCAEG